MFEDGEVDRGMATQAFIGREQRDSGYYRWIVLAAAFVLQMLAAGTTSFAFGVFVKPVAEELGIPRGDVNLGLMLLLLGSAVACPFLGRLLDRFPTRWIVIGGSLCFGIGASWLAWSVQLWMMCLALLGPVAVGMTALGALTSSLLITRWFDERIGRALGIVGVSASVGGVVIVPLLSRLIAEEGWRTAVLVAGWVTMGVGLLLALFVIRERAPKTSGDELPYQQAQWTVRGLLVTRDFWLLVVAVGSLFAVNQAVLSALVAYGQDLGFDAGRAALLVSAVSLSSIIGKLVVGALADYIDKRLLLAIAAVLLGVLLAILLAKPAYSILLTGCLLSGAAIGGIAPIWGGLIYARFGAASFGLVMGLMVQLQMPFMLLGLRYVGGSYDASGSYDQAFRYFLYIIPLAVCGVLAFGRPGFRKI